jgi:hypothetical protein
MASTRALMSEPNTFAYSASKGGLVALCHSLAASLAPDVRVNAISPGWIHTGADDALREEDHAQHWAGRVGRPADVAEFVLYLLDREGSGFMTGANLVLDGGMTRKMVQDGLCGMRQRCKSASDQRLGHEPGTALFTSFGGDYSRYPAGQKRHPLSDCMASGRKVWVAGVRRGLAPISFVQDFVDPVPDYRHPDVLGDFNRRHFLVIDADNGADQSAGGGDPISGSQACENHPMLKQSSLLRSHQRQIEHGKDAEN